MCVPFWKPPSVRPGLDQLLERAAVRRHLVGGSPSEGVRNLAERLAPDIAPDADFPSLERLGGDMRNGCARSDAGMHFPRYTAAGDPLELIHAPHRTASQMDP